jgi:hypothetical protein
MDLVSVLELQVAQTLQHLHRVAKELRKLTLEPRQTDWVSGPEQMVDQRLLLLQLVRMELQMPLVEAGWVVLRERLVALHEVYLLDSPSQYPACSGACFLL